jgi:hypothetical protein
MKPQVTNKPTNPQPTPIRIAINIPSASMKSIFRYVAVFDPLDGSSNIDAAISTGTIFGIFLENEQCLIDPEGACSLSLSLCMWLLCDLGN